MRERLSENFYRDEFDCNCGCGSSDISLELVKKLQILRNELGSSVRINSGVRCETYNSEIGGVDGSSHVEGLAADIVCETSQMRQKMLSIIASRNLFIRIGIGKRFLHLDIDNTKPPGVYWLYP